MWATITSCARGSRHSRAPHLSKTSQRRTMRTGPAIHPSNTFLRSGLKHADPRMICRAKRRRLQEKDCGLDPCVPRQVGHLPDDQAILHQTNLHRLWREHVAAVEERDGPAIFVQWFCADAPHSFRPDSGARTCGESHARATLGTHRRPGTRLRCDRRPSHQAHFCAPLTECSVRRQDSPTSTGDRSSCTWSWDLIPAAITIFTSRRFFGSAHD
jgi:hypothetical protein